MKNLLYQGFDLEMTLKVNQGQISDMGGITDTCYHFVRYIT